MAGPATNTENAFRLLGLSSDATWREVLDAEARLRRRAALGRADTGKDEASLRRAVDALADPRERQIQRLYAPASLQTSDPDLRQHAHALGQVEHCLSDDDTFEELGAWHEALEAWQSIAGAPRLAASFVALDEAGGFERRSTERDVRAWIQARSADVLDRTGRQIRRAIESGNDTAAARGILVLDGLDIEDLENREELALRPVLEALERGRQSIERRLSAEIVREDEGVADGNAASCRSIEADIKSLQQDVYSRVVAISRTTSIARTEASEIMAELWHDVSMAWSWADDLDRVVDGLRRAKLLSRGTGAHARIVEQLRDYEGIQSRKRSLEVEHERTRKLLEAGHPVRVIVAGDRVRMPRACSCCLAETNLKKTFTGAAFSLGGMAQFGMAFPLCADCRAHGDYEHFWDNKAILLGMAGVIGATVVASLLFVDTRAGFWWAIGIAIGIGIFLGVRHLLGQRTPPLAAKHACMGDPVELHPPSSPQELIGNKTAYVFRNAVFGVQFAQANDASHAVLPPRKGRTFRGREFAWHIARHVTGLAVLGFFAALLTLGLIESRSKGSKQTSSRATRDAERRRVRQVRQDRQSRAREAREREARARAASREAQRTQRTHLEGEIDRLASRIRNLRLERDLAEATRSSAERELEVLKIRVERAERRSELGLYVDRAAYKRDIQAHNRYVREHNEALQTVRELQARIDPLIAEHNNLVDELNSMGR